MLPLRMIALLRSTQSSFSRPCRLTAAPLISTILPLSASISTRLSTALPMTVPFTEISSPGQTAFRVRLMMPLSSSLPVSPIGRGRIRSSPSSKASLQARMAASSSPRSSDMNLPPQSICIRGLPSPAARATMAPKERPLSLLLARLSKKMISLLSSRS